MHGIHFLHAQDTRDVRGNHHGGHHNELGVAFNPVYFLKEKEFSYGLHVHYMRNIDDTKFGLGIGYERIFDTHKHNTLGIVGSLRVVDNVVINASPGVTFEDENPEELSFVVHLETTYEFELHNFHLGPVLELAYDPEDFHLSLGLHIAYGF
jgi:hypothetical protein